MPKAHWLDYVKQAAIEAVRSQKPCDYLTGTVIKEKPLTVRISDSDGLEIEEAFLDLTRNVTDFKVKIDGQEMTVHNALKKGDKVLMIRRSGGQEFMIMDRVVG